MRVALTPLLPGHIDFVYSLVTDPDAGLYWKYRGLTPAPDVVWRQIWEGVSLQKLIWVPQTQEPAGITAIYNYNPGSGFAYVHAIGRRDLSEKGLVVEGALALVDYAFTVLPLRKLYFEILSSNVSRVGRAITRFCDLEATLVEHERIGRKFDDLHIYALTAARWQDVRSRFVGS